MEIIPKRYNVFVGDYGSGKTEISISFSKSLSQIKNKNIYHVDVDIVNPYFRSGEKRKELNDLGIETIMPNFELTNVDVPSLPADINKVFIDDKNIVIFDVGGDETGATVMGQYSNKLKENIEDIEVYMVLNPFRPLTANIEKSIKMIKLIELRSKLKITKIINNANLAEKTSIDDIVFGYDFAKELSQISNIDFAFTTSNIELYKNLPLSIKEKYFPLNICMRPNWLEYSID